MPLPKTPRYIEIGSEASIEIAKPLAVLSFYPAICATENPSTKKMRTLMAWKKLSVMQ